MEHDLVEFSKLPPTEETVEIGNSKDSGHSEELSALALTLALGRANLLPASPPARSREPMDAACPMHTVCTGGRMYCIVS
mmetsp:Transcript_8726/g.24829  ORF Transcript_8726/g.24829 Transcript_8726/m.24829 type:complete len:80 (-) Transcript_8726:294-533(-)